MDIEVTDIMGVVGAIVTSASIITAATPTPSDDKWWGKVYKWIEFTALVVGKAKETADKKEPK